MIATLEKYKFKYVGTCQCIGPKTYKYRKGDFVVYWNKRKQNFKIKQYGKFITTFKPETELENVFIEKNIQA